MERYTASKPLLPSALPPKGEASRYGANIFLKLIALPSREGYIVAASPRVYMGRCLKVIFKPPVTSHQSLIPAFKLQECGASRRMYIAPPYSAFKQGFQTQSRERTPRGLSLNPEPVNLTPLSHTLPSHSASSALRSLPPIHP